MVILEFFFEEKILFIEQLKQIKYHFADNRYDQILFSTFFEYS